MLRFIREISGVDISLFAEGQLESPVIMNTNRRKVKYFFKNNSQKILRSYKMPEIWDFLPNIFSKYFSKNPFLFP
jgi:hypothetical protein